MDLGKHKNIEKVKPKGWKKSVNIIKAVIAILLSQQRLKVKKLLR